MKSNSRLGMLALPVVILPVALTLAFWFLGGTSWFASHTYAGTVVDPPRAIEEVVLTDQHGQAFRLGDQQAPLVLVNFGYTYCPDVCPITLAHMVRVKRILGTQADAVRFVMITVDPERDTPEVLGQRLAVFDPTFVGLTGDRDTLQPIWDDFGVYVERQQTHGSSVTYLVAHSAYLYLVNQHGRLCLVFPFKTPPEDIAADIKHILQQQKG
jgi:protein SCO1/2